MKNLSAEEIIKLYKVRSCLVRQDKILKKKMEELEKEQEELQEKLRVASSVSRVYKGVPISGTHYGWCSRIPTKDGKYRSGRVYLNAHNNRTWGIQLHTGIGFHDDVFLGAGYPSQEAANDIVLEFLVTGIVLPQKDRKY